jgi:hypothetical protein
VKRDVCVAPFILLYAPLHISPYEYKDVVVSLRLACFVLSKEKNGLASAESVFCVSVTVV